MWKTFLSSSTLHDLKELMMSINTRIMSNMIKCSQIPVFLNNMNELRNTVNVSKVEMPSPFAVIFDMTQFTL
jgi:hypothetical protein